MTDEPPLAVLWDMDGTIVDTEPMWMRAETELVESFGGAWSHEQGLQLVGNGLYDSAAILIAAGVRLEPLEVIHWLTEHVQAQLEDGPPWRPGARELLAELRETAVPMGLVTMSFRGMAVQVAEAIGFPAFDVIVAGDDVTHHKPHPEPYLAACRLLGVQPAQCVALEDSPTGVRSAVDAGVPTVAIPHILPVPTRAGSVQVDTLAGIDTAGLTGLWRAAAQSSPTTT